MQKELKDIKDVVVEQEKTEIIIFSKVKTEDKESVVCAFKDVKPIDIFAAMSFLVDVFSKVSKLERNQILDDLKTKSENPDSIQE